MPILFPRINIRFNNAGIANKLRRVINENVQPADLFEVYNTAKDPDGQPYWEAVNNGTPPKIGRQIFSIEGQVIQTLGPVAGNPAYHMRERAIPLMREYFKQRVRMAPGEFQTKTPIRFVKNFWIGVMEDTTQYVAEKMADFTPTLQAQYYAKGYTPEPGLLRKSYKWRRKLGRAFRQLEIEKL